MAASRPFLTLTIASLVFAGSELRLQTHAQAPAPAPSPAPAVEPKPEAKSDPLAPAVPATPPPATPETPATPAVPAPPTSNDPKRGPGEPRGPRGDRPDRPDRPDGERGPDGKSRGDRRWPGPDGRPDGKPDGRPGGPPAAPMTPQELEAMRDRAKKDLDKLTTDQRAEVWKTVFAVLNLPPEQRKTILGMEDDRRQKAREEVDRMVQSLGIKIPKEQNRRFFHRYFSERRNVEETLKKEQDARREALMRDLGEKLKTEFGNQELKVENK